METTEHATTYLGLAEARLARLEEESPGFTRRTLLLCVALHFGDHGERVSRDVLDRDERLPPVVTLSGADVVGELDGILCDFDPDRLGAPVVVELEECDECEAEIPVVHGAGLLSAHHDSACSLHPANTVG